MAQFSGHAVFLRIRRGKPLSRLGRTAIAIAGTEFRFCKWFVACRFILDPEHQFGAINRLKGHRLI